MVKQPERYRKSIQFFCQPKINDKMSAKGINRQFFETILQIWQLFFGAPMG